ncbi:MAG: phosphomethylpyrimidine synthase, partial [Pseudomonadota bacterium]|nr:phosphomethylpyrimidine synthase [Pseudomonadota bacterium]
MSADSSTAASNIKIGSYPASEKIYVEGSRPDIQVPMRKITLSDTPVHFGAVEKNAPIYVYDTSGVYTDPNVEVDLKKGLKAMRAAWILERDDTEELETLSSKYGQERLADKSLDELRFELMRKPRRAKAG